MKLKEHPNHLEAFEYSWEKSDEQVEPIFQTLLYLCKLYQLNQKALSIKFPKGDEGIFI